MSNTLILADTTIGMLGNLYSLNDLHKASGGTDKHKPSNFMRNAEVQELIEEIEQSSNLSLEEKSMACDTIHGGANRGTYVCKELVYRYAMWISPKFSLMVIRAFDAMTQGEFTPCTQTTQTPKPQSPKLSQSDYATVRRAVYFLSKNMYHTGTATNVIYARLRSLCEVEHMADIRYDQLTIVQNELYRIERILRAYTNYRQQTEKTLMSRICMGDSEVVGQAMIAMETTATAYAQVFDEATSAVAYANKVAGILEGR